MSKELRFEWRNLTIVSLFQIVQADVEVYQVPCSLYVWRYFPGRKEIAASSYHLGLSDKNVNFVLEQAMNAQRGVEL